MMTPPPVHPLTLTGRIAPLGADGKTSAIDKRPASSPFFVSETGLVGDEQADLQHHGGREKALHHYPFEHYASWRAEIGDVPALQSPGRFGENFSTHGWTETNICVGDIIRFGASLLQVSQGRQPCWKLNRRFGVADMALRVQRSGRAGWYYRVLEPGAADDAAMLNIIARPHPEWPLQRLNALLYGESRSPSELAEMAALPVLAQRWRDLAQKRLESGRIEDWSRRLYGDAATNVSSSTKL